MTLNDDLAKCQAAIEAAEEWGLHVLTTDRQASVQHLYVTLRIFAQTVDTAMRHFANMLKPTVEGMEETEGVPGEIQNLVASMAVLQMMAEAAFLTARDGLDGAGMEDPAAAGKTMHEIEYPSELSDMLELTARHAADMERAGRNELDNMFGFGDQGGAPHMPGGN
jgi:hypothetical protein